MKRISLILSLSVFCLLPGISQVTNESESNDSFDEADPVIVPGVVYTSMGEEGDNDYFKVDMAGPGVLTFKISDVPADQYLEFKVYDSDRGQIAVNDSDSVGKGLKHHVLLPAGISYFKLRDENWLVSTNTIKIEISLDDSDSYEVNNTFETASLISPNSVIHPQLFGMNDELGKLGGFDCEYYMLDLDQSGVLDVDLSNLAETQFMMLKFYDAERTQIGYIESPVAGVGFNHDMLLPEGVTYLYLWDGANQNDSTHLDLVLTLDTSETFEPNNSFETATIIPADTVLNLKLWGYNNELNGFRKTDLDYFKIPGGLCLNQCISVSNVLPLQNIHLRVYDSEMQQIGYVGSPGDGVGFDYCMDIAAGEFYVRILDYNNNSLSDSISVEFNCSIKLGSEEMEKAEPDVFVYPNPGKGKIRIEFPNTSQQLFVLNSVGQIVESRILNGEEMLELEIEKQGIYFIRINTGIKTVTRKLIISDNYQ